jgi:hypothetical protein
VTFIFSILYSLLKGATFGLPTVPKTTKESSYKEVITERNEKPD